VIPDAAFLRALVYGGAVLGGGGGGSLPAGLAAARAALAAGTPHIVPLHRIDPRATLATLSAVGTVGTTSGGTTSGGSTSGGAMSSRAVSGGTTSGGTTSGGAISHRHFDRALAVFVPFAGREIGGFIASEVGPRAVTYGLRESAITGIPVVDAPCNGRAHPLFTMGSLGLHRRPRVASATVAVGGAFGSARYVELAVRANVVTAGRIVRERAAGSGVALAVVRNPLPAAYVRRHAAVGGLAFAARVGHVLLARLPEGCGAVLAALAKLMDGRVLAHGRVARADLSERQGFTVGRIAVEQADGGVLRLLVCNELMAADDRGHRLAAFPDLITLFDRQSGLPLGSAEAEAGRAVAVFAVPRTRLILGSTMQDAGLLRGIEAMAGIRLASSWRMPPAGRPARIVARMGSPAWLAAPAGQWD